jgi:hypothetical protein
MPKTKFQCGLEQDNPEELEEIEAYSADGAAAEYAEYCFYNRDYWECGAAEWDAKLCIHDPKKDETKFYAVEVEQHPHFSVAEINT